MTLEVTLVQQTQHYIYIYIYILDYVIYLDF